MSQLEPLLPDQRAVVALVLRQGRSYDEIAKLLGIPVDAVRARAQAGLAALAGDDGLPAEITAPLADYLLGQQSESEAEATRGLLAESAPARGWANTVAARLEGAAPDGLPPIPADLGRGAPAPPLSPPASETAPSPASGLASETASPPAGGREERLPGPRPRPVREAGDDSPPPASRLGGALLIAGVLAVVAVVLFLVLRGGEDPGDEQVASSPTPAAATPTPTAAPAQVADTIDLRSPSGGEPKGVMTVFLQDGRLQFQLVAEKVPPSSRNAAYAVWFTGPGDKVHRLGFTNPVGADGNLGIQGPGESNAGAFPKLYATYANVVVSQESSEDATRPSRVVLTGKLPKGR